MHFSALPGWRSRRSSYSVPSAPRGWPRPRPRLRRTPENETAAAENRIPYDDQNAPGVTGAFGRSPRGSAARDFRLTDVAGNALHDLVRRPLPHGRSGPDGGDAHE